MKLHNRINNDELKQRMLQSDEKRVTLSFYQYALIDNPHHFRDELYRAWEKLGVFGRIYVAAEGINGQLSVPESHFEAFKDHLYGIPFLNGIRLNIAIEDDGKSFYKLKIKVRDKIVADGLNDETFDVTRRGRHLTAEEVNRLMEQAETVVVDMRNHYESEVGHFQGGEMALPEIDIGQVSSRCVWQGRQGGRGRERCRKVASGIGKVRKIGLMQ